VFIIFPTTRKGIGEDGAWGADGLEGSTAADEGRPRGRRSAAAREKTNSAVEKDDARKKKREWEERKATTLLGAAATLSKLLPTGTTLAFTWGLIGLLTLICAVVRFTDSVTDLYGHT
jgi:hypothetical protein